MTDTPGRISKETTVSLALVITIISAIVGGALWVSSSTSTVKQAMVESLSSIKADVRVIGEQVQAIRNDIIARPTLIEVRSMIDASMRQREKDVERILDEIKARLVKVEASIR